MKKEGIVPRPILFTSILAALIADAQCLNYGLIYSGLASEGIYTKLYAIITVALCLLIPFTAKYKQTKFNRYIVLILIYIYILYVFTSLMSNVPDVPLMLLVFSVFAGLVMPQFLCISPKILLRAMMAFSVVFITKAHIIFMSSLTWKTSIDMSLSYAFLAPIIANVLYLQFYFKSETAINKVISIVITLINLYYFTQIFLFGSRGPVLSCILLVVFLMVIKPKESVGVQIQKRRLLLMCILTLICILFFQFILNITINIFNSFDIRVEMLEKMQLLAMESDLSNGRTDLNRITWNGIINSPIWGNGMDQFYIKENTTLYYPHNFILQILYDGGIIFLIILFVPFLYRVISKYRRCTKNEFLILTLFLFCTIPGAMFSQNLWHNTLLWFAFGVGFSNNIDYKGRDFSKASIL